MSTEAAQFALEMAHHRGEVVPTSVSSALDGVSEPVLERAFEYWRNIDKETGDLIAKGVNGG
jgi:catalase